jgi:hypothetical protein
MAETAMWISFGSRSSSLLMIRARLIDGGPKPWAGLSCATPRTSSRSGRLRIGCRAGLLFVPIPEEKAGKNRLHLDFSPVDQTAEVERLFPSVLGGPMSGSVARRGWYSPTLKAMSSASSGDGFGPIPWSRRHRTALHSENRTPAVPLTGWLAQRPPSELTTWRRRVEERWKRRRGRRIIRAARPSYRANSSCRASNAAGSTAFHSCRLLAHRSMTR